MDSKKTMFIMLEDIFVVLVEEDILDMSMAEVYVWCFECRDSV